MLVIQHLSSDGAKTSGLITQDIGALGIKVVGKQVKDMATEMIDIQIKKRDGKTHRITDEPILLRDFINLSTYEDLIHTSGTGVNVTSVALCELSEDGSIPLGNNDQIEVEITGIDQPAAIPYTIQVNGIPYPGKAQTMVVFKNLTFQDETSRQTVDTLTYDMAIVNDGNSIDEVTIHFEDGNTIEYSREEWELISLDANPIQTLGSYVTTPLGKPLNVSLVGVTALDVQKNKGDSLTITARESNSPIPFYTRGRSVKGKPLFGGGAMREKSKNFKRN